MAKDFADYIEKSSTKVIGCALAALGYGTQFTADALAEGERLADAPVERKRQPAERSQSTAQASTSPRELKLSLAGLKKRAIDCGYLGADPGKYGAAWTMKMDQLFGGPLQPQDYGKASVLGKIASDIELFAQSHTDGAVTHEA